MRLFKSSNKSQASLDRLTGSRDHSPTQQPDPTYPHAQAYGGPPQSVYPPHQYQQQQQQQHHHQQLQHHHPQVQHSTLQNPESYYTEGQPQQHPAHVLSRTQSSRAATSGVGDPYVQDQQPTVNVVPPGHIPQQNQYIPGQTQFGQSQNIRTEKESRRTKRGFFGVLSNSKKDDKEEGGDRRSVGRASSILKKGPQSPLPLQTSQRASSSFYSDPRQAGLGERYSSESLTQDPHYNQYRDSQDQFESPQSQHTRQSIQYVEDSRYQPQHPAQQVHTPQDRQYNLYQLPENNNSDSNATYQDPRVSNPNYDTNHSLRPPSQASLGPPSPLAGQPPSDSRPSSSNTAQQRFSSQSQQQQQPPPPSQPQTQPPSQTQHPQLQHPQPQHSLPPSQQATPQPTPQPPNQPQAPQQQQQQPQSQPQGQQQNQQISQPPPQASQSAGSSQQVIPTSNMPRNEVGSSSRRHDESIYAQQDPRNRTQNQEQGTQGRNTPPPTRTREDPSSLNYEQLLAKHEELQAKYSKVKRYYFEREAQVTQLQNTVANQRLSLSKTSLDDTGYATRFERLNGAIQNLSFNVRKDWRRIPNWLAPVCNRDAHSVGTKEMTAVGRACITRWLYESIFERVFLPGIDPNLSSHLKAMERTLRRAQFSPQHSSEQQDDLLTKITTWRLTTVESLQDVLASRQSDIYTETLVMGLTKQLEFYLRAFLADPPPPGLSDGLGAIVGQTVSIAQNIPLESRDICVEYFMPGSHVAEAYMRLEAGMTALTQPGSAPTASDLSPGANDSEEQLSTTSSQMDVQQSMNVEDAIRESAKAASASAPGQNPNSQRNETNPSVNNMAPKLAQQNSISSSKEKKGFLGGLVNKKPTPALSSRSDSEKANDGSPPDHGYTLQNLTGGVTENKIRFAVFLAVEVRGRSVLKDTGKEPEKVSGSSKDGDEKKDTSAAGANSAMAGSAAGGAQKSAAGGLAANILCKAPVYAFE